MLWLLYIVIKLYKRRKAQNWIQIPNYIQNCASSVFKCILLSIVSTTPIRAPHFLFLEHCTPEARAMHVVHSSICSVVLLVGFDIKMCLYDNGLPSNRHHLLVGKTVSEHSYECIKLVIVHLALYIVFTFFWPARTSMFVGELARKPTFSIIS